MLMRLLVTVLCITVWHSSAKAEPIQLRNSDFYAFELDASNRLVARDWTVICDDASDASLVATAGQGFAIALREHAAVTQTLSVPANSDSDADAKKDAKGDKAAGAYWLVSFDVLGLLVSDTGADVQAGVEMILLDDQGRVLGGQILDVSSLKPLERPEPMAGLQVDESSFENSHRVIKAMDGDAETIWHTAWREKTPKHPHYVMWRYSEPQRVEQLRYLPRPDGGNGTIDKYALYVSDDGVNWGEPVATGRFSKDDPKAEKIVTLSKPVESSMFLFEARSEIRGGPWASAAELELLPRSKKQHEPVRAEASETPTTTSTTNTTHANKTNSVMRGYVKLDGAVLAKLSGRSLTIKIAGTGRDCVVVDNVQIQTMWQQPSRKHLGRSNGGIGPDWFEAAPLGFAGLLIHNSTVLPVAEVRPNTAAHHAGLKAGDLITAVNAKPLGHNDCRPGWQWVAQGHEMALGRALIETLKQFRNSGDPVVMTLEVLRDGDAKTLDLKLDHPGAMASTFPFDDPVALQMHRDLCERVLADMKPNGDHGGFIRSGLGGLALLSARDPSYAEAIKLTADWFLAKYPTPDRLDSYQFWPLAYAGMFMAEYYLATGDQRVLPWMQRTLDWVVATSHRSRWGMMALGHDPGGLPYGYKSLVAPATHCLVFEALAERCGVDGKLYEHIEDYIRHCWSDPETGGHGGMGYNASYKDLGEFWSRTGLMMLALHMRDTETRWQEGCAKIMSERWPWFRNSHAYGEPGGALGLATLAAVKPDVFKHIMHELRPSLIIGWEPGYGMRYTTPHMGMPYMEGDNSLSACYAIVLGAANDGLHMTGSTDRNWLDVSEISTPLTSIHAMRSRDNLVTLSCDIPGPAIRYTTDGSEPDADATLYRKPFKFNQTDTIKARAFDEQGEPGPDATFTFGLPKHKWKIIEASGGSTPEESIRRASFLIDGDPATPWLADRGFEVTPYPQHVIIDLGEATTFGKLQIHVRGNRLAPIRKWLLHLSDDGKTWQTKPFMAGDWPDKSNTLEIEPNKPTTTRYIKITAVEGEHGVAMSELELYPPAAPKWTLMWQDEFNTDGHPDPQKWGYEVGFVRNREAQIYTKRRLENVRVVDGKLIIEAHRERYKNPIYRPSPSWWAEEKEYSDYTSGSINTLGKQSFHYGRIEIRAKLPQGRGVWPAIWMMGDDINEVGWPRCGEIDIMEFVGKEPGKVYGTVHRYEPGDDKKNYRSHGGHLAVEKPWERFHVYAIEWCPERIDFYIDETKYFTYDIGEAGDGEDNPFRKPHYLLINLAMGGSWGGKIDDDKLPQRYEIDYVRAYEAR